MIVDTLPPDIDICQYMRVTATPIAVLEPTSPVACCAPVGDGAGATFVLELGAMTSCERSGTSPRAAPRARVRVS